MSVMSELDYMVRQEGARTVEDFIGHGIDPERAKDMAEVVSRVGVGTMLSDLGWEDELSIPGGMVSVDAAKLIHVIEQRAAREVIFVSDEDVPDEPTDFYWEDER
jgi:hypothetical protein